MVVVRNICLFGGRVKWCCVLPMSFVEVFKVVLCTGSCGQVGEVVKLFRGCDLLLFCRFCSYVAIQEFV